MIIRTIVFLLINFAALAIGGLFTSDGVSSEWYTSLNQAPWTPPGWVFGAAWTTIMVCFSFFMASLWTAVQDKRTLVILFAIQWVLNVSWNPIFFYLHKTNIGLVVISALTILVGYFLFNYRRQLKTRSLLILPYFLWLIIATSLNAYIVFNN